VFRRHPRGNQVVDQDQIIRQHFGQPFVWFCRLVAHIASIKQGSTNCPPWPLTHPMKELLRSTDPTIMAFASALLQGEDIDCFQMDVNMSILEGGIGIFPRRMMVHAADYDRAVRAMRDNDIPLGR